jgi:predicted nucleic acid-binding protein
MPGRLLDTNVIVALLRVEAGLRERIPSGSNYLSNVVLGELLLGALLSRRAEENLEPIRRLASTMTVLSSTPVTAEFYPSPGRALETRGRRLPQNDQWIAATALQHGRVLVTRDARFEGLPELLLEKG